MIFGLPYVVIGVIAAALIAGIVSFLGLILGKEQKISEFRQAWIDGLRDEVSALISNANALVLSSSGTKSIPHFVAVNDAEAHIRLRLNPKEPATNAIIENIERISKIVAPGRAGEIEYDLLNKIEKDLAGQVNLVLKKEWARVKRGEPAYWIAKHTALAVVVVVVLWGVVGVTYPNLLPAISAPP